MRIDVKIDAGLTKWVDDELAKGAGAVTNAVRKVARKIEKDLEAATAQAGLGKLSRAWASKVYPEKPSLGAAAIVYAKGEDRTNGALWAYTQGATIAPKFGKYLWIPTDAVIKRGGAKIGPRDFEEAGIPLRFVPPMPGRPYPLLVAENFMAGRRAGTWRAATPGRIKRAAKDGRGLATVVMFIGARDVKVAKRFDFDRTVEGAVRDLPNLIVEGWK